MTDPSPEAPPTARLPVASHARVLLAWEYGAGYTHVVNILAVARHLRAAGIECLAALHDVRHACRFAELGIATVQNHVWPQARRWAAHEDERPHLGFLDVLGNLGFGKPDWVAGAIAHYDGIFDLFRPDLVLAENAYGAQLAARKKVRSIAFGFGQFLPAIVEGRFAGPDAEPTSWSAAEILSGLNEGLARGGRAPLDRLEDMFDVDATFPFGPAAFDPRTSWRPEPPLPALVNGFRPGSRAASGEEVFVYLQGSGARFGGVLPALLSLRRPIRAHIPDLDPADRDLLVRNGAILEPEPTPVRRIVERSRCVLHHGGIGLTAACLSAGLPQVIVSGQLDQRTAGDFVAGEGLGEHRHLADGTTGWIVEATRRAYDDDVLRLRCLARAAGFDAWFEPDPARTVAEAVCWLLGLPLPPA